LIFKPGKTDFCSISNLRRNTGEARFHTIIPFGEGCDASLHFNPANAVNAQRRCPPVEGLRASLSLALSGCFHAGVFRSRAVPVRFVDSGHRAAAYEDREGALWLGTENSGVTRYYRGRFTTYTTQHGLASNKGGFWSVNDQRLYRFVNGRLTLWTRREALPNSNIHSVAEDQKGALWLATDNAGVIKIENGRVA
jgi:ligand-binding sensor domain-containing protein